MKNICIIKCNCFIKIIHSQFRANTDQMQTNDLLLQKLMADLKAEIKEEVRQELKALKGDMSADLLHFNRERVREQGRIRDEISKFSPEINSLKDKTKLVGQLLEKNQRAERKITKLQEDQKTFIAQINQTRQKMRQNENKVKSLSENLDNFNSSMTTVTSVVENLMNQYGKITQYIERIPKQITEKVRKQVKKDFDELKLLLEKTKWELRKDSDQNKALSDKKYATKADIQKQVRDIKNFNENDQLKKKVQLQEGQLKELKTELSSMVVNLTKMIAMQNSLSTTVASITQMYTKQIKNLKAEAENSKILISASQKKLEKKISQVQKLSKKSTISSEPSTYTSSNSNLYSSSVSQSYVQPTNPPNFYSGILEKAKESPMNKSGSQKNLNISSNKGKSLVDPESQNFWRYRIDGSYIQKRFSETFQPTDLPKPILGSIAISTKKTNIFTIENKNGAIFLGIFRKVPTFFGDQKIETVAYNVQDGRVYVNGSFVHAGKTSYIKDKIQMTVSLNKITWSVDYMLRGQYKQLTTRHSSQWYPFVLIAKADDKLKWD